MRSKSKNLARHRLQVAATIRRSDGVRSASDGSNVDGPKDQIAHGFHRCNISAYTAIVFATLLANAEMNVDLEPKPREREITRSFTQIVCHGFSFVPARATKKKRQNRSQPASQLSKCLPCTKPLRCSLCPNAEVTLNLVQEELQNTSSSSNHGKLQA